MGERCALNAPGQASGSGLESSPSPSHGSTGTGTSQSLGPSDRELIERARADDIANDPAEARFLLMALADRLEALASRPAVAEGWVAEMTGYQEWLRHLSQGFLMSEPLRRQACADLIRVTALLSAALKP